ncbi:hypothetical protein G9A89_008704 [Geosiphon pyriformis]|nr:hypothetical protein G9A89_008704 [Geosiphon pyriformis]
MDKSQKYDRQLRLWQANGQVALESSKVCLINGTATGCEILKNLVLPGIGSFTVLDNKLVDGTDVGNNFFLDLDSIGSPRAERVAVFLQELNEDVKGFHMAENPINVINNRPEYFLQFSLVISTELHEKPLLKLSEILWKAKIPLVVVRTVGFTGYVRLVLPEHEIIETHPENINDLRLDVPFPALSKYAQSIDLDALDNMDHAHIPYVVILLKYLEQWRNYHGHLPITSAEKNTFKQTIINGKRTPDQENFDEALAGVWKACSVTKVSSSVEEIFKDPACENITAESSSFWINTRAVRDFVANEGHGLLPLAGALPDMKADTTSYVSLQNIYRKKALEDVASVRARVDDILTLIGRPRNFISDQEVETFCKNAAFIQVIRYRSLQEEYINNPKRTEIGQWLRDPDDNIVHYVLIRAIDRFYEAHQRYPDAATLDDEGESEFHLFKKTVTAFLNELGINTSLPHLDDFIHEICRAGGSEQPNIAALVGGIASQEIIKLITSQYIPINNTCIFAGIKSTSSTYIL